MARKLIDGVVLLPLELMADGTLFLSAAGHRKLTRWAADHKAVVKIELLPADTEQTSVSLVVGETLTAGL